MMSFQTDNEKNKISVTRRFLMAEVGKSIDDFVKARDWQNKEMILRIINDVPTNNDFKELEKFQFSGHIIDRRTPVQFVLNLVLGWIMEDAIAEIINKIPGFKAELGSTNLRSFESHPLSASDLTLYAEGKVIPIEITEDFSGYTIRNNMTALRDNKYMNLKNEKAILVNIILSSLQFFAIDISKTKATLNESYGAYGGKPAYVLKLGKTDFYFISDFQRRIKEIAKEYTS
jgi:hypothetical protein